MATLIITQNESILNRRQWNRGCAEVRSNPRREGALFASSVFLCLFGCLCSCRQAGKNDVGELPMSMELTSSAFQEGQTIPKPYTGDSRDLSPPLQWSAPPSGTKSLALICEDPDAPRGTFTHWVLFDLPAESRKLGEGVSPEATLPDGSAQGTNDFHRTGYSGPAPPPGKPHRYVFNLYALDKLPAIQPGATKDQLVSAMKGHILDQGQLTGMYAR
jgi:Raf kinase inhibitor-like YbhB/YbcL family protein